MTDAAATPGVDAFSTTGPTLRDLGEGSLVARLVAVAGSDATLDDALVWTPRAGRDLAVSIDALVEGIDFRRAWTGPRALGRRAFAVAASDLAAMGASPAHCLATLCARPDEPADNALELQRGLVEAASAAGCAVSGGDVSGTDGPLVLDVCVIGHLPAGNALRRSAGTAGDLVAVTGVLGRAAAGLRVLTAGDAAAGEVERAWVAAQLAPRARLAEGRRLLASGVRCGADISDGLLADLTRTAAASGCAADIWADSLPLDPELRSRFGDAWLELAIAGGEDFELAVSAPAGAIDALLAAWPADLAPLTVVGELRPGSGVRVLETRGGAVVPSPSVTAHHFS